MNVIYQSKSVARVRQSIFNNPDHNKRADVPKLIAYKVQIKVGAWLTVWAAACDLSDGDTRTCLLDKAEHIANHFKRIDK